MKILRIVLLSLATLLLVGAGVSFFLPDRTRVDVSREFDCELSDMYPHVRNFKAWSTWSAWNYYSDSSVATRFQGNEAGRGAFIKVLHRNGNEMTIKVSDEVPERLLKHEFISSGGGMHILFSYMTFEKAGDKTKIRWTLDGKVSGPIEKYKLLFTTSSLRKKLDFSFDRLAHICKAQKLSRVGKNE